MEYKSFSFFKCYSINCATISPCFWQEFKFRDFCTVIVFFLNFVRIHFRKTDVNFRKLKSSLEISIAFWVFWCSVWNQMLKLFFWLLPEKNSEDGKWRQKSSAALFWKNVVIVDNRIIFPKEKVGWFNSHLPSLHKVFQVHASVWANFSMVQGKTVLTYQFDFEFNKLCF